MYKLCILILHFCYLTTLGIFFIIIPYLIILKLSIPKSNDYVLDILQFTLLVFTYMFYKKTHKLIIPE